MVKKKNNKVILGGVQGAKLRLHRFREKEKKQEKELSQKEHPIETKIGKGIPKKLVQKASRPKRVFKKSKRAELRIGGKKVGSILNQESLYLKWKIFYLGR